MTSFPSLKQSRTLRQFELCFFTFSTFSCLSFLFSVSAPGPQGILLPDYALQPDVDALGMCFHQFMMIYDLCIFPSWPFHETVGFRRDLVPAKEQGLERLGFARVNLLRF